GRGSGASCRIAPSSGSQSSASSRWLNAERSDDDAGRGSQKRCDGGPLVTLRYNVARRSDSRREVTGVPVADRKRWQGRNIRRRIEAHIEIGLVVVFVAGRESGAHRAGVLCIEIDERVEIEMVRPTAHRRGVEAARHELLLDSVECTAGVVVPTGQLAERRLETLEQIAPARRAGRSRAFIGGRRVECGGVEPPRAQLRSKPGANVRVISIPQ